MPLPNQTPNLLAEGQLSNAKATIFLVPVGFRAQVDVVTYYNTTGGALNCSTYIKDASAATPTSRLIDFVSAPANQRTIVSDRTTPIYLDSGDLIEGNTTAGASVNYHIWGWLQQKG